MEAATSIFGRDRELLTLDAVLCDAKVGRSRVLLVSGEPGIGKSRLCEELGSRAQVMGFVCAFGRAWEAGGAPAYWPFIQMMRTLERRLRTPLFQGLFAELTDDPKSSDKVLAPTATRFMLFDRVARALELAAQRAPLVLVLEDAHAADVPSLSLLEFLTRELRDVPLLLTATYREVDARATPEIDALLSRIRRDAQVIALSRLDEDDVTRLLAQRVSGCSREVAQRIFRATEGNPLFVVELIRVIERDPNALTEERLLRVDGLRTVIREHLRRLPSPVRAVLDAACVLGREANLDALAAVLEQRRSELESVLHSAVDHGVLRELSPGRMRFTHVLLRDTLHADLEPALRTRYHLNYADYLARGPDELRRRENLAEIAHHLLAAGPNFVERAVPSVCEAAEQALRALAFEHAAELCMRALDSLAAAGNEHPLLRFELLTRLGTARIQQGEITNGKATCRAAADVARQIGDPVLLARATLAYGSAYVFGLTDPVLVSLCEEALRTLKPEETELRARIMARLAAALQPASNAAIPVARAREAIALSERIADAHTRLEVRYAAMSAMMDVVDPRERRALNREILMEATKLGERALSIHTRRRLVIDLLDLGDPVQAQAVLTEYEHETRSLNHPHIRFHLPMFRSALALMRGDFKAHEAHVDEAREIATSIANDGQRLSLDLHMIIAARIRGRAREAEQHAARVSLFPPPLPVYPIVINAMLAAQRRDLAAVQRELGGASMRLIAEHGDTMLSAFAAEAVLFAQDRERAAELRPHLERIQDEGASFGLVGYAVEGPGSRLLMGVCELLGDRSAARASFERALSFCERGEAKPFIARVLIDWAEMLARRGDVRAHSELVSHAQRALDLANALDITDIRERAAKLLSESPSLMPALRSASLCTIEREGEMWRVSLGNASCLLRDSRGLAFLSKLVARPGREQHVLTLVGAPEEVRHEEGVEAIDVQAKQAYRRRVAELREEIDQASEWNDHARVERLTDELESIEAELAHSLGLGGRVRKTGDSAEKARVNVQRRIADALKRVREQSPEIAHHLEICVRTGLFCAYEPERGPP